MMPKVARKDALPEGNHALAQDTGCRWHCSCLNCPFGECLEDSSRWLPVARNPEVVALLEEGYTPLEIGRMTALSARTVYRIQSLLLHG
jgi:hypothetical protein